MRADVLGPQGARREVLAAQRRASRASRPRRGCARPRARVPSSSSTPARRAVLDDDAPHAGAHAQLAAQRAVALDQAGPSRRLMPPSGRAMPSRNRLRNRTPNWSRPGRPRARCRSSTAAAAASRAGAARAGSRARHRARARKLVRALDVRVLRQVREQPLEARRARRGTARATSERRSSKSLEKRRRTTWPPMRNAISREALLARAAASSRGMRSWRRMRGERRRRARRAARSWSARASPTSKRRPPSL